MPRRFEAMMFAGHTDDWSDTALLEPGVAEESSPWSDHTVVAFDDDLDEDESYFLESDDEDDDEFAGDDADEFEDDEEEGVEADPDLDDDDDL